MKKLFTAAILLSVSLTAFPSEKGGNTFRSHELEMALQEYEVNSCPDLSGSKSTLKQLCAEVAEEIMSSPSDNVAKAFYVECCKNKH